MQSRLNELCQILGEGSIHRTDSELRLLPPSYSTDNFQVEDSPVEWSPAISCFDFFSLPKFLNS